MKMLILLLMLLAGCNSAEIVCDKKACSCVNCGITEIPADLHNYTYITELNLSSNNITSLAKSSFSTFSQLEVLNLTNNSIVWVDTLAFEGLANLKTLDLSHNLIAELPANIQLPSKQLEQLYLNNNRLTNLDIMGALKDSKTPLKVALGGNPWDCSCSLMKLSLWLNSSAVTLEDKTSAKCATPNNTINTTINAIWSSVNCKGSITNSTNSTSATGNPTTAPEFTVISTSNSTAVNGTRPAPSQGNSWRFLVGVLAVGVVTLLLIITAVKFPRWYDFVLSYNHQRLKEDEEPYMFEEEFNVDFSMGTNEKTFEEEETVVVFEQTHSFVQEEDGFIEDKYIDERDIRAES